jgi:hypothetical protein
MAQTVLALQAEVNELAPKENQLQAFLKSEAGLQLSFDHQRIIRIQLLHMKILKDCLNIRIGYMESEE